MSRAPPNPIDQALDDWLLVNRVIFFNVEDKQQVEDLVAGGKASGTPGRPTKPVELDEPRGFLEEISALLLEAKKLLVNTELEDVF